jgi:hypothetical protein
MKEQEIKARGPSWLRKKAARRSVLGGFGAAALTSATTVFGSQTAQAYDDACCNLAYAPSNYTTCMNGRHYAWSCQFTQTVYCSCCERKRDNGSYFASAYHCEHI